MKILVNDRLGANHYIAQTYVNTLRFLGHDVVFWDIDKKCAFDMFSEFEPDICFLTTWQLRRDQIKNIAKRPNLKVVLSAPEYREKDSTDGNIQNAEAKEIDLVKELKDTTGRPDYLCHQYFDKYTKDTHPLWKSKCGVDVYGIPLSADITQFYPVTPTKDYSKNIFFCGGKWNYKNSSLDSYLTSLMYPNTNLSVGVWGQGWSGISTFGLLPDEMMKHYHVSSLISVNLFEPHSMSSGIDLNQRSYQIPSCMGFQMSQRVEGMKDVFGDGDGVVYFDTQEDYLEKIVHFKNNPSERIPHIEKAFDSIWSGHTSLHRVNNFFSRLGLDVEANHALDVLKVKQRESIQGKAGFLQEIGEFFQ